MFNFAPEAMSVRIFDQKSFPEYNAKTMDILMNPALLMG
jgi:hypothetical protein